MSLYLTQETEHTSSCTYMYTNHFLNLSWMSALPPALDTDPDSPIHQQSPSSTPHSPETKQDTSHSTNPSTDEFSEKRKVRSGQKNSLPKTDTPPTVRLPPTSQHGPRASLLGDRISLSRLDHMRHRVQKGGRAARRVGWVCLSGGTKTKLGSEGVTWLWAGANQRGGKRTFWLPHCG